MLSELTVSQLGVIESSQVVFGPGLNAISGETGAGKTMVMSAIGLLVGNNADAGLVRHGTDQAQVSGLFEAPMGHPALLRAQEAGALFDESEADGDVLELVATRSVAAQGRSRAILGGVGVPRSVLRQSIGQLVTVHGQSDQMRLRSATEQRAMVDNFAGPEHVALLATYREAHQKVLDLTATIDGLRTSDRAVQVEIDGLTRAVDEIESAGPVANEDSELASEAERLTHAEELYLATAASRTSLDGAEGLGDAPNVIALLESARRELEHAGAHDPVLSSLAERIREAGYQISDVAAELAEHAGNLDPNPERLEQINQRIAVLRSLKQRYGPELSDVLAYAHRSALRLAELDSSEERLMAVAAELDAAVLERDRLAKKLMTSREAAGRELSDEVDHELAGLAMPGAHVEVRVGTADSPTRDGGDTVEFWMQANPGSPVRPIAKGASGGELSRVMLAIEVVLAARRPEGLSAMTLIFDEIDAGVGGEAAIQVGRRLARLAQHVQVIVVTHLAQVAAFADRQIMVAKTGDASVTRTDVHEIEGDARITELARMMSGHTDSHAALTHAQELLQLSMEE